MRVGDLLEWLAIGLFAGAAYLATHLAWPPMIVGGIGLGWEAQCYSTHNLLSLFKRGKTKDARK